MNKEMKISIVVPVHNEVESLHDLNARIVAHMEKEQIPYEIVYVDDHSGDGSDALIKELVKENCKIVYVSNDYPGGFGFALRKGLDVYSGDMVAFVMADLSDDLDDLVVFYNKICEGYDCAFGTRFNKNARLVSYPFHKLVLNRLGNWIIQLMFWLPYNDVTNAFKCYSRNAIDGARPFVSCHFNITVELPLKCIFRGFKWVVVPNNWYGRMKGIAKWKIKEYGARYFFTLFYVWLEKNLAARDYNKKNYWIPKQ